MKPLLAALLMALAASAQAEPLPGANVESLLAVAREGSPDVRMARLEAEAARERIGPAGAAAASMPPQSRAATILRVRVVFMVCLV